MKTDYERLKKLRAGEVDRSQRGVGKTFSACHYAADWLESGEGTALWLIPDYCWLDHIYPMLREICRERNIEHRLIRARAEVLNNRARIIFRCIGDEEGIRSLDAKYRIPDHGEALHFWLNRSNQGTSSARLATGSTMNSPPRMPIHRWVRFQ